MKRVLGTLCFLLIFSMSYAQTGSLKGFVYDQANGEPLSYVTVLIKGAGVGAKTNDVGFYNVAKIPAGTQTVIVQSLGYERQEFQIEMQDDFVKSKQIYLKSKAKKLGNVVISTKKLEKKFDTRVATVKISAKEVKLMPSVGGEPDIAQYLQVMPGVVSTGDQGGQLYIRGGSPIQNKILLDGMTIYNPFHSIGLYSVFETDAIRSAEVMSGGFGAEYGDRTSAIVNVTTKNGNKNRLSGKLAANPILAKAFLEGPLGKPKPNGETSTTFLASLKHSYLKSTSSALYGSLGEPYKSKLPYTFTDAYGKVNVGFKNGSKFSLFGFSFNDRVNFQSISDLQWKSFGMGSNFVVTPDGSSSLISGGIYYSDYDITLAEADGLPRTSAIGGFDANIAVTSYFKNYGELKYGVEFNGFRTEYNYFNFIGLRLNQDQYTTQMGGFITGKKNFNDKLILEPGVRIQYYASLPVFRIEPRFAMKYNISDKVRFKASAGMYSQNLISSKSDRDIVNLFTGFLTAPDFSITDYNGVTPKNNLQKSYHIITGFEVDAGNIEFTIEPWFKNFTQLLSLNRYKLLSTDSDWLIETGKAYGLDITAKYVKNRFFLWAVYSYGLVNRFDGVQTYPTPFDRRHNVNVVTSYKYGKNKDWTFSLRFNYGSPLPFTLTQSFFEQIDFTSGLGTDILGQNGNLGLLYDDNINGGRLSHYHRLDLSAAKKFIINSNSSVDFTIGLTNAYDRQNIFYIDRIRNTREYQFPIFPTLGLSWNF